MPSGYEAEKNARLLLMLTEQFQARDWGAIGNFFEVDAEWCCPCCIRSKPEIARLDKNSNLLCSLHRHHDHFVDAIYKQIPRDLPDGVQQAIRTSMIRFEDMLICNDCNVAEPSAKRMVGAPAAFSFTPYEIAGFIDVRRNQPHVVDEGRARAIYAHVEPFMREVLSQQLQALRAARQGDLGTFEHIAGPAARVILAARQQMDKGKP